MKTDKYINICFASDNGYAEHLLVAIFSLMVNLDISKNANIYILD
jgi:lipopolysaccharide biosynthesis glycosyltransferase